VLRLLDANRPLVVISIVMRDGKIHEVRVVGNPNKLTHI
jgi:hypothetical protein